MEGEHLVLDLEIEQDPNELPGKWTATHLMGVTVAVVYSFNSDRYTIYFADDLEELRRRLLDARRITGYNIWKFDFPVLWGLEGRERVPQLQPSTDDLLRRIWLAEGLPIDNWSPAHGGFKLDDVTLHTLNRTKIGHGAVAPVWWKQGRRGDVVSYCIDDVKLTRDLCRFIDDYGYVIGGKTPHQIPIPPWDKVPAV